jgi:DNA-binding transcriptional ArsR family regulator
MVPESDELSQDIREIKWHQEAIDSSMELLIRANKAPILAEILSFFGNSRRRAEVYLAVDGDLSVSDIATELQMKPPNVSTELTLLNDFGLIETGKLDGPTIIYKKRRIDRILGLTKELRKKFELQVSAGERAEPSAEEGTGSSP